MKKLTSLLLATLALSAMTGCSSTNKTLAEKVNDGDEIVVGILQPVEHSALGSARSGFVSALESGAKELGVTVTVDYQNAGGEDSQTATLAKSLVSKCDIVLGIGTGASVSLQSQILEQGRDIPLLFTAVTDPVDAGLVKSLEDHSSDNCTGTSDDNPVETQIDLVKSCLPTIDSPKIGVLYTASETNSKVQADRAKTEAEAKGMSVETATCTGVSDLLTVATNLAAKVDCLYIPTDNVIASNMNTIKTVCDTNNLLCIVGEEGMLSTGGHLTYSVNYTTLGERVGEMAVELLGGKTANEIDVEKMLDEDKLNKVYSSKNLSDSGITLPDGVLDGFTDVDATTSS